MTNISKELDELADIYYELYKQALELDDRIRAEVAVEFMKYTKHLQQILVSDD